MKKIAKAIKFIILASVWSFIFIGFSRFLLNMVFKFDFLSHTQWKAIAEYWNKGGVVRDFSDYMFFVSLIIVFVLWLWGIRKVNKIKYSRLFLKPLEYFANRDIKKYESIDTHVVIKNISVGEKLTVEDIIKERIKNEQTSKAKDAEDLRKTISEKIIQRKEQ